MHPALPSGSRLSARLVPAPHLRYAPTMKTTCLLITCACLLTATARGDDPARARLDNWHHWRGPLANGTAPKGGPPVHWDAKTNVKWKAELPGRGSATPIVW